MEESAPARHRAAIADLSEWALDGDFDLLLGRVAEASCGALDANFCAVLELAPGGESMLMRAAHGAGPPASAELRAGSAFGRLLMAGGELVLTSPHMAGRVPRWLLELRMAHGISHRIGGTPNDFGALCVFRTGARRFGSGDLEFLRAAGNLIALAARIDRRAVAARRTVRTKAQASELIAGFLANTSHEIRNPLHVILGYNEIIAEHLRERGDSLAPFVAAVERAGRRLLNTIDRLLAYSRLESGAVEIRSEETALAPMIEAIVRGSVIAEPAIAARCDPDHLAIALANLADNAVKFTQRGEIAITVYRGPASEPAIRIRDTGVGIDPSYMPRLFEPFSQEQSSYSRKFEGSGLGLALARRYLELNGASISVESKKGVGSTFTIHLPPNGNASL
jgi:signal transduction histidine kinase